MKSVALGKKNLISWKSKVKERLKKRMYYSELWSKTKSVISMGLQKSILNKKAQKSVRLISRLCFISI